MTNAPKMEVYVNALIIRVFTLVVGVVRTKEDLFNAFAAKDIDWCQKQYVLVRTYGNIHLVIAECTLGVTRGGSPGANDTLFIVKRS